MNKFVKMISKFFDLEVTTKTFFLESVLSTFVCLFFFVFQFVLSGLVRISSY